MPDPTLAPLLLDAQAVAEMLSVSLRTVRKMDSTGRLPAGINLGRCRRWIFAELRRWCDAKCPRRDEWEAMKRE